jgi:ADP-ribose pyrophosphatase YjhB (NUDIX family)
MGEPAPTAGRRFARYRPTERLIQGRRFWSVPEGGLCLSAFLIIRSAQAPARVLLGKPDPKAPWEAMATLEEAHLRSIGDRWILPASHLLEFESPSECARRIGREQLGSADLPMRGPEVFSEAYPSAIDPNSGTHWDLHFLFQADWSAPGDPISDVWRELGFLDVRTLRPGDIARGHADILALGGLKLREARSA